MGGHKWSTLSGRRGPKGTHGQGSVFLDAFLERFFPDESFRAVSQDCSVRTEKIANGQRRIDIYLESPSFIIGIENKPWAADQDGQLRDYAEFLTKESRGKKWMLIYLSNRASSDRSISPDERDKLICAGNLVEKSFIEIEDYVFDERSQLVVDPSEEKLKSEFAGVKRSFIPIQAIIRIDEVEKTGVSKISSGDNVSPFPVSIVGAKADRKDS